MNIIQYLKERWITYIFIVLAFLFFLVVYKLDKSFNISKSNATYILIGWTLLFVFFVVSDYFILSLRIKNFKRFCETNAPSDDIDEFTYSLDKEYAELVHRLVLEFEKYKSDIFTKSSEELEFITKWVHDVKLPISATRLILENYEGDIPNNFYQDIDTELFSIEQSVQRVFYEIKSNTFSDDYKIANVSTKRLIANTLKNYSNFFSYKRINISIEGEDYDVLTDEKWSGYIISQIIYNAVKHTPQDGIIAIKTKKIDDKITISIRNTGKGILEKDIKQIFKKGYTSSENRNGAKSTGYALYLSKKLSVLLGHKLTVESKYGEYAEFSLIFIDSTLSNVTKMLVK